jgi:hypothetical protein
MWDVINEAGLQYRVMGILKRRKRQIPMGGKLEKLELVKRKVENHYSQDYTDELRGTKC